MSYSLTVCGAVRLLDTALVDDLHVVADAGVLVHHAAPQEAVLACGDRKGEGMQHEDCIWGVLVAGQMGAEQGRWVRLPS